MALDHLRKQLQNLQNEIENLPVDHGQRDKLHALVDDIGNGIDPDDSATLEEADLQERLDELVSNFEVEHPTVAAVLKDIMVKLASIGI
ncbi:DUF4404 family protein [Spongiibacter sp. KMU-158]|uniref:DUF4404 family protein n=1 Tax=Spongiibacter pelagi TaxID=2760804 RepID=A0A927C0V4_9GAMM|nr:DUF4404 family protein [Spongiibacter pelagi]MBD2858669.1 DUF4404 family protein [Spongiibacter pelagi]